MRSAKRRTRFRRHTPGLPEEGRRCWRRDGERRSDAVCAGAEAFGATSVGRPPAKFGKGDIGILNYALTLEYLEAAFYNGATAANLPLSPQAAAFLKVVTRDENAHVAFLKKALGTKAVKSPTFEFGGSQHERGKIHGDRVRAREHGRSRVPRAGAEHQI